MANMLKKSGMDILRILIWKGRCYMDREYYMELAKVRLERVKEAE